MSQTKPTQSASAVAGRATAANLRPLRCAVVGVGRMGRHHARKYARMEGSSLVAVVDMDEERRAAAADELGCPGLAHERELLDVGVDAVSIAAPTTAHLKCARPLLEAGIACLIEKPLAETAAEAEQLVALAAESRATLMVGHIERFNPVVRAVQQAAAEADSGGGEKGRLTPRFIEVHRVSPMTFRSIDVSVVMDMMIHDLDVVLMLMGGIEPVEVQASGLAVLTEHEDVCSARLTFAAPAGRCIASLTASRLAFKTERKTRIISEDSYASIDYGKKSGVIIRKTANEVQMQEVRDSLRRGADLSELNYADLVTIENLAIDNEDQLEVELRTFLHAVRTGDKPPIDAQAGLAAVRTAERIIAAARADWGARSSK